MAKIIKLILSTTDPEEAENALQKKILSGISTDLFNVQNITGLCKKYKQTIPISVTVSETEPEKIIKQAMEIAKAADYSNLVVKIPIGFDQTGIIKELSKNNIQVECSSGMNEAQAILAANAGAHYFSLRASRIKDLGGDPYLVIKNICKLLKDFDTEIIVGDIRPNNMRDVVDAFLAGANAVCAPLDVLEKMSSHPKTTENIIRFVNAYHQWGGKIKAVIFDMDGVISDTQQLNSELEASCLKEHDIEISAEELARKYAGIPERDCAEMIFKEYRKEVDLDKFVEDKLAKMTEYSRGGVSAVEGALELIRKLKESNFKLAVASSSKPEFINLVLAELKIRDKFDILTSGEEVKLGKPNPDLFLLTARKLGLSPSECVVIEDAKNGVIAAKKAGMKCIWLTNQGSLEESEYPADITVESLKKLQLKDFL